MRSHPVNCALLQSRNGVCYLLGVKYDSFIKLRFTFIEGFFVIFFYPHKVRSYYQVSVGVCVLSPIDGEEYISHTGV